MSKLIALVFDDLYKADEARAALFRMEGEGLLDIDETAVVVRKDGEKVRITQDINIVSKRKQTGHLIGLIAANLTGMRPLILAGTIAGEIFGKLTDDGVTNSFIDKVKAELTPGKSALLLCARSDDEDRRKRIVAGLSKWSPRVLDSDLPEELERKIDKTLQQSAASTE
ncbi:hypothetical protein GCM10027431_12990 [Lysobacter rhizosphaerae]